VRVEYAEALARVRANVDAAAADSAHARTIIGIAGAPGAGKTTLAQRLVADLVEADILAVHVPMDGYHLANATLDRLGLHDRKGAVDTFDGWSYVALMRRIANDRDDPIYAPDFDRTVDEPVAGSILVAPETQVVVSEGNYLLLDEAPWGRLAEIFTMTWFCEIPEVVREERLVRRHMTFGRDERAAREWVRQVDGANARLVQTRRRPADLALFTA